MTVRTFLVLSRSMLCSIALAVLAVCWHAATLNEAPRHPGLWLAFGNQHIGFSTGPVTGEILAALVCGEAAPADPAPFAPGRYLS